MKGGKTKEKGITGTPMSWEKNAMYKEKEFAICHHRRLTSILWQRWIWVGEKHLLPVIFAIFLHILDEVL